MDTGHLIGGIVTLAAGLFSLGIGVFKPQGLMRITKRKLKTFTFGREPGDKAAVITCIVAGAILLIAAAVLFTIGAANV
jgi:UPF0716 family protein affecting phage T7 exclusion